MIEATITQRTILKGLSIRKVENHRLSVSRVKGLQQMCSHPFVHTDEEMGVSFKGCSESRQLESSRGGA